MTPHPTDTGRDTICAISTPPGTGGIAVVRLSGPQALQIAQRLWRGKDLTQAASHTAHLGTLTHADGQMLDQAVATVFRGPASYTGDDTVELSVHGSPYVQQALLQALTDSGARLAEPGEYTRRAFTAGKLDLAQAEAVADVIAADSRAAHRIAMTQMRGTYSKRLEGLRAQLVDLASLLELELDFAEEDVQFAPRTQLLDLARQVRDEVSRLHQSFAAGTAIKDGIPVAIVGAANAGKSSLLNALVGDDRAIVSNIPGTTRDTVEETIALGDYRFRFIDTAGLRHTDDTVERLGIERSHQAISRARIIIAVTDATTSNVTDATTPDNAEPVSVSASQHETATVHDITPLINPDSQHLINVLNKTDLVAQTHPKDISTPVGNAIAISALTGDGLDALRDALRDAAAADAATASEGILVTNARHAQALGAALDAVNRFIAALQAGLPADLAAQDLRETIDHLGAITARIPSSEILHTIFSRFCIGK